MWRVMTLTSACTMFTEVLAEVNFFDKIDISMYAMDLLIAGGGKTGK